MQLLWFQVISGKLKLKLYGRQVLGHSPTWMWMKWSIVMPLSRWVAKWDKKNLSILMIMSAKARSEAYFNFCNIRLGKKKRVLKNDVKVQSSHKLWGATNLSQWLDSFSGLLFRMFPWFQWTLQRESCCCCFSRVFPRITVTNKNSSFMFW